MYMRPQMSATHVCVSTNVTAELAHLELDCLTCRVGSGTFGELTYFWRAVSIYHFSLALLAS
jgi:hypothetical protein